MTYYIGPKITDWQRQIILGTILGGSSIVKPKGGRNSYLSMRGRDAYWLEYKSQELRNLASPTPFLIENNSKYFRWHSLCYPMFNDFHETFYQDGQKRITIETLNELRDIGLAIWFLDGGRIEKNTIIFNTNVFKEAGSQTIAQYFNEINITAKTIIKKNSFRVVITAEAIDKFLKIIAHRIPKFMFYRFGDIIQCETPS